MKSSRPLCVAMSLFLVLPGCDWNKRTASAAANPRPTRVARLTLAVVAEDGDRYGETTFDRARFDRDRAAARAAGADPSDPAGFRCVLARPERAVDESDASYTARLEELRLRAVSRPDEVEWVWLFCEPTMFDHAKGVGFAEWDFERIAFLRGDRGQDVLTATVRSGRRTDFRAYTDRHLRRRMALALDGEVLVRAVIQAPIDRELRVDLAGVLLATERAALVDLPGH